METNTTHRFTVITDYGHGAEHKFEIAGSIKQARAKLAQKLVRLSAQIAPARVTKVVLNAK